jgi:hypothetical protein
MVIVVNGGDYRFQVNEDYLEVKNERLYNTKTRSYEGIEGDIISFNYDNDGVKGGYKGYVDGYTNGVTARIRGIDKTFNVVGPISVTHISRVSDVENPIDLEKELSEAAG